MFRDKINARSNSRYNFIKMYSYFKDMSGLAELYTKIQLMQSDMDSLATTANRLLDDREQQDLHMNVMYFYYFILSTVGQASCLMAG